MTFQIQSTTEGIERIGGIALIGEMARSSGLRQSKGNRRSLGTAKDGNTFFILKRNLRRESTEYGRAVAQTLGEKRIDPAGTVVYTGTLVSQKLVLVDILK